MEQEKLGSVEELGRREAAEPSPNLKLGLLLGDMIAGKPIDRSARLKELARTVVAEKGCLDEDWPARFLDDLFGEIETDDAGQII